MTDDSKVQPVDAARPEPAFKVGQIVVAKRTRAAPPFRVLEVKWFDDLPGWFYRWNRGNWASEGMVRALTDEEIGDGPDRVRDALAGLWALYGHVWDRVDGCLVIQPESVARFDAAFEAARDALQ